MLKRKIKVGVVGCGGICKATYMDNMVNKFAIIDVVGCYDLIESRMDYMVEHYGIKKYDSLEAIVSDPEIEIIVNLTYTESHFLVSSEAMKHGKHVYCEKMMAPDFEQAKELARLAEENHVMYTTAPDTFLGAHEQSARFYIDNGIIEDAALYSDSLDERFIERIAPCLKGCRFEPDAVLNRLLQLEELTQTQQQQLEQIASLTRQDSK